MCLVKVKGEVEDDVIVPARVVERDEREIAIVETAPAIIERPHRSRRHSSSSSSSSSTDSRSIRSDSSYGHRRYHRGSHNGGSSYDGRSRSRERYYRRDERISSGGSFDGRPRGSFRYVDPAPRGSAINHRASGANLEVRQEITRAEEHLQRAAELEKRAARERRAITYDPRSSSISARSYEHRDGSRRRSEVVVVQEKERYR